VVDIGKEDRLHDDANELIAPREKTKSKVDKGLKPVRSKPERDHEINIDLIRKAFWLGVGILVAIFVIWVFYFSTVSKADSELTSYIITSLVTALTLIIGFLFGANRK